MLFLEIREYCRHCSHSVFFRKVAGAGDEDKFSTQAFVHFLNSKRRHVWIVIGRETIDLFDVFLYCFMINWVWPKESVLGIKIVKIPPGNEEHFAERVFFCQSHGQKTADAMTHDNSFTIDGDCLFDMA